MTGAKSRLLSKTRDLLIHFTHAASGASTVAFALSAVALAGAVGVAIDISRLQSTQESLQQTADNVCRRVQKMTLAAHPTSDDVASTAKTAVLAALGENAMTHDKTGALNLQVDVQADTSTPNVENYTINIQEDSPASFGRVVGYSGATIHVSQQCSRSRTPTPPPPSPPSGGGNACDPDNYIYVAGFRKDTPPSTISASTLAKSSDQKTNQGYIATILDNSSGAVLSSVWFTGNYNYTEPPGATSMMTLYIQDVNLDGSYPQFCSAPQTVQDNLPTCDYTQFNHDTVAVKSASHTYWGASFKLTPDPAKISKPPQPTDVVISGVTKSGYKNLKVTLATSFTPNTSTMVNFNNGGSSQDATAQDDYFYNLAIGKFNSTVDANGNPVGNGASMDGVSLASSKTPNNWLLVHVFNGTEAVWQDRASGNCFDISSPIALDLTGLGEIATTGVSTSPEVARTKLGRLVSFDTGEGDRHKIEWLTGNGQGFLVDNRDGRAAQDMKMERLFGADGEFTDGYQKLAAFDHSGSGVLKGADLDGLAVWIDDGDGVAEPEEIVPLAKLGITAISVRADWTADKDGHHHLKSYAVRDGKPMLTEDVWLGVGGR